MELPQEVEGYIKECKILRDHNMYLQRRLKEKDDVIERARTEAKMNAQAMKKFVEENQKLAVACANLLSQCKKWEKECSLYDHDREVLMEFANEADERAKDAEIRVHELEDELMKCKESQFYRDRAEMQSVGYSAEGSSAEQILLEALMIDFVGNDKAARSAYAFLETNSGVDACNKLLKMCNSLRPSTKSVLTLTAELKNVEEDKEHLRVNLARAEEEVNVLFEENKLLDKENKRLMRHEKERHDSASGKKLTISASSTKGNKRKSSKGCSSIERKIDFSNDDSLRSPRTSLQHNFPEFGVHNK